MLKGRNIVIKRIGGRVYLPTKEMLEIEQPANIPSKQYSMCRITNYDEATGILHLKMMTDVVTEQQFYLATEVNSDDLTSSNIKKLVFDNSTPRVAYSPPVSKREDLSDRDNPFKYDTSTNVVNEPVLPQGPSYEQINTQLSLQVTEITIELPINHIKFENGKVSFEYNIHQVGRKVHFDILNPFIKKEFDSIKNYFSKVFGTKKFTTSLHIEHKGRELVNHSATSPQVSKIDASLFEIVEEYCIEDSFLNNSEDEVYSLKEKAEVLSRVSGSDKIRDETWLLNKLFTKERTKHYFHLRYLSSKHLREVYNLHMTGKPISFIFLLSNGNGYSLIWETYSTEEATYVWKLDCMNPQQLSSIIQPLIERIKWLRQSNKMSYIREKPDNFARIEHDYSGEDMGFNRWREHLEGFLTITDYV